MGSLIPYRMPFSEVLAYAVETALVLGGLVVLWQSFASPAARMAHRISPLPRWEVEGSRFFLSLWLIFAGFVAPGVLAYYVTVEVLELDLSTSTILVGLAAQLGMFAGWLLGRWFITGMQAPLVPASRLGRSALADGALVFLAAMPIVLGGTLVWQNLLELAGIPIVPQDLIGIFSDAESPLFIGVLLLLAVCGAPIVEELVFRAGIFRFARTRLPRLAALVIPAMVFASAHSNLSTFVPLVLLGIVFSLAFERTADIRVPIVAHALFNLNSSLLVLVGGDFTS